LVDVPHAVGLLDGFIDAVSVGLIREDGELDLDAVGVAERLELAE
jgi:hypothetical protein